MTIHIQEWKAFEVHSLELFEKLLGGHDHSSDSRHHPWLELVHETLPCKVGGGRARFHPISPNVSFPRHLVYGVHPQMLVLGVPLALRKHLCCVRLVLEP
jgi:hypothetical protein